MRTGLILLALVVLAAWPLRAVAQPATSVVVLIADTADGRHRMGSAFAVQPGVFATRYRLIAGAVRLRLVAEGAATEAVVVRAWSAEGDVALIGAPSLASLRPIPLADRIPATTEHLLMIGCPYGLAPTGSEVGTLMPVLVPVSEFDDPEARPLFIDPPDVGALLLVGVAPRGLEGGPVLDADGRALGVVASGLDDDAGYAWAMPASGLIPLLARSPLNQRPAAVAWTRSPFVSPGFRLDRYVTEDTAAAAQIAAYGRDAEALRAAGQALATHIGGRAFAMTAMADRLDAAIPQGLAAANAAGRGEMVFLPAARAELADTARALEARARIEARLRRTVALLEGLADRTDLDETTRTRIRTEVRGIVRAGNRPAAERYDGADASALAADLHALAAHAPRFTSLEDARAFSSRLRRAAASLEGYDGAGFSVRLSQEDSYFSRAERVLRTYAAVIIYRLE